MGILFVLEGLIPQEAHDQAAIPIMIAGVLAGGALVRYVIADPYADIRNPGGAGDGDPFFAFIGFVVIVFPLGYLWWRQARRT
jgi:hypothetical protein